MTKLSFLLEYRLIGTLVVRVLNIYSKNGICLQLSEGQVDLQSSNQVVSVMFPWKKEISDCQSVRPGDVGKELYSGALAAARVFDLVRT
ncbi:MAG: hypothetical protein C0616_09740 [Desulfuromonas sp.]|nr:MAG: hypothetical protein C0616_09740 [Desulfuromonas sp.]